MWQPNVPRKTTSLIQTWGCVLLAVLCVFFSFSPLITLDTGLNGDEIEEMIEKITHEEFTQEIPDEVGVSAVKIIKSISLIVNIIDVASDDAETTTDNAKAKDIEEMLKSEEGVNTIVTVVALANTIVNAIDTESGSDLISIIFGMLLTIVALLAVLVMTFIVPVVFLITALIMLINALTKMKDPELAAPKLSKKLPGLLTLPMAFMVFQVLVPGMGYGSGAVALFVLCVIAVVLNMVVSRLRKYTNEEVVYATVVQGGALVGAIAYVVFFLNILKTGIFNSFTHGRWSSYMVGLLKAKEIDAKAVQYGATPTEFSNAWIVDGVLILVYAIIFLSSMSYLTHCAQRMSLACGATGKKRSANITDNHIVLSVFTLIGCAIPLYVKGTENLFVNYVDDTLGTYGSLVMKDDALSALKTAFACAIVMLVIEIAVLVLRKVLCADLSGEDREAVLTGTAKTPDEKIATAEKILADAAVAAAAAAPAEAAPAEAAPAAEEAPAEDAPKAE